jgi:hypothetical protein
MSHATIRSRQPVECGRPRVDAGGIRIEEAAMSDPRDDADEIAAEGDDLGPDANQLDADNAVEEDTIESLDPENPPA